MGWSRRGIRHEIYGPNRDRPFFVQIIVSGEDVPDAVHDVVSGPAGGVFIA